MARNTGGTTDIATQGEPTGTRHRRTRRSSAKARSYTRRSTNPGLTSSGANRHLEAFSGIMEILLNKLKTPAERSGMLKTCDEAQARWSPNTQTSQTETLPTETPLQGQQSYAAGAR